MGLCPRSRADRDSISLLDCAIAVSKSGLEDYAGQCDQTQVMPDGEIDQAMRKPGASAES